MEIQRRYIILAPIVAFIAWGFVTDWLPSLRWLPQAFLAGIAATVTIQLWIIVSTARRKPNHDKHRPVRTLPHLAFTEPQLWTKETAALKKRSQYISEPLYPDSPVVTQRIDKLIVLVLRDFVNSWYGAISRRPTFTNEVDRAIRAAMSTILDHVIDLDIVGIGVSRIVPMVTTHMSEFYEAERAVRGKKLTRTVTESDELDLAIAGKFKNGNLHPAASLAYSDTKMVQQAHVRSIIMRLLPQVLPPNMNTSPAVTVLVKEIVTCAVLSPIIGMLADPDTWNQLIANYGRTILQERKTVRKLRAALEEHAQPSPMTARTAPFPKLAPGDNERKFEKFIRAIRKCNTLSEARRFRSEVASQLHRESSDDGQDPVYLRRLDTGKRILDQRIGQLGAGSQPLGHVSKASQDGPVRIASRMETATLREILYNATGLSYFMEYMDRQRLMRLVQFWIVVDGFRNPLEEDTDEPASTGDWTDSDRVDLAQINEGYLTQPEIKIEPIAREAVKAFLKAGKNASNSQYQNARRAVLRTQTAAYEEMQEPHFSNFKKTDLWFKLLASEEAAPTLAPTTNQTDNIMPSRQSLDSPRPAKPHRLNTQPANLKAPDLRRAIASASDLKAFGRAASDFETPTRRSLDTGSRAPLFDDDLDNDHMNGSIASLDSERDGGEAFPVTNGDDPQIVDAMQAALTDIMDEAPDKDSLFGDSNLKSPQDNDSIRSSMEFPRPSSPALNVVPNEKKRPEYKGKPSIASLGLLGTPGRRGVFDDELFAEEQPKFLEDERDDSDASDNGDDEAIHEAAPGDLGLAEAIDALTMDIEKLVAQESIVDSLTKKAELTNNAAELRILRKSKASLQREINRKELQRQQYIVQESDNSLYGRAAVAIASIMVGKEEDGKEFAIYVIEVKRQAGEQMPAASWSVTRRYSEFHDLNKRLRARFPMIRNLDFPRRQIGLKLQRDFLQKRRVALEKYLRELLKIPAICRSKELRAFLSEHALPSTRPTNSDVDTKDFVTRIYNSVTDGMDEFLGNIPVLDQLSLAGQNLISAATTQLSATQPNTPLSANPASAAELAASAEAEAELRAFETRELEPFVKPICDLFLELFELNRENNWLRGRAVVIVLQQLLGGTIERKVRENAKGYLSDEGVANLITVLIDNMWPGGKQKAAGVPRTLAEKSRSRQEAGMVLASLVPELVGSVVGRTNAQAAARRLLAMINNQRLLTHLVFTMLDEIVKIVFGDAATTRCRNGPAQGYRGDKDIANRVIPAYLSHRDVFQIAYIVHVSVLRNTWVGMTNRATAIPHAGDERTIMENQPPIKSVAVIGAGAAGAITAAALVRENVFETIRVFERRGSPGGTWIYDANTTPPLDISPGSLPTDIDPPLPLPRHFPAVTKPCAQERFEKTPVYDSLTTNVPDIAMAFSDVPFGDGPFVGREVPERYIKEYFSKHGLGGLLVLGTTVEDVSVLRDGEGKARERWRLTLRRFEGGRGVDVWWQEEFDAVVLGNGHYSVPFIPKVKGLEEYSSRYPGKVMHSKYYRTPTPYKDKKILIIGNSASGHDLSTELTPTQKNPSTNPSAQNPAGTPKPHPKA
ncbi:hypothetical protein Vi05172_g9137 [Venturia inaequalis]|nr:hypothetical protein Vi05172_g9137 [Venturia inaequalis]